MRTARGQIKGNGLMLLWRQVFLIIRRGYDPAHGGEICVD